MEPEILFCDNHLLAVVKPPLLPTQKTESDATSLEELAKAWLRKQTGKEGSIFLQPIHRLDKVASGIVLFARSSKALRRLNEEMRLRKIEKTYYALIQGFPPADEGQLEHYLAHGDFRADIVTDAKKGKKAQLLYKVTKKFEETSLLEIILVTGRYHQIRAQLGAIGCPILGDRKYGSTYPFTHPGIALHHGRMSFIHPVTKLPILLTSTFKT